MTLPDTIEPAPLQKAEQNCFVIIGFGNKTDLATGRVLNLDKTYTKLIKPAFDELGINCFRAIDVNRSGSIDALMYKWIYEADFVVTDISTLNANVFYELGVRHAQRPNTTIVISEAELLKKLPFDINSTVIHAYEHLGEDIADGEAERFREHLADLVRDIIDNPLDNDSPVYTYLSGMEPPKLTSMEELLEEMRRLQGPSEEDVEAASLAKIIEQAEAAKNRGDYLAAIGLFKTALESSPNDTFLMQRLTLVTYKSKAPDPMRALHAAEEILAGCKPSITTDPETLGLAGAINKRLHEETGDLGYFDKSLWFYERGFYVKQDYYNGINAAYLHTLKSVMEEDPYAALVSYGHANMIRQKTAEVCRRLIESETFDDRGDREWVYQTLAQAYLGMGEEAKAEALFPKIEALSKGSFDMTTFREQNAKLIGAMEEFERRYGAAVAALRGGGPAEATVPATKTSPRPSSEAVQLVAAETTTVSGRSVRSGQPIAITVNEDPAKPVKSVTVKCKVTYS